ncbi:MAG: D-alanyl-D-alanine carboxypeptidase DacB [Chlamydiae bacterium]|nr:D-alanyl-D-alanine carboxypeptidase DacB [Chlamydiota bacterium]
MKFSLFFFAVLLCAKTFAALDIDLESESAIVINIDSQSILYEKNANETLFPASITKIATALYALKEVGEDLDVMITADQDCVGSITTEMQKAMNFNHPPHWQIIGGTHMQIAKGDSFSLETLLYGMMLVSANDASNMIAKYVSGSIRQFMIDLNDYLEELGCTKTHFLNPHGLQYPKHTSSAKDIALITSEALKHPMFRKIIQTSKYGNLRNSNCMVRKDSSYYYPHAIGVKTGFHSDAKHNLVTAASYEGRTILAVLLRGPSEGSKYEDARKVFQLAFSEKLKDETILEKGSQPFKYKIEGLKKPLKTYLDKSVTIQYFPSEKPQVTGTVYWHPPALPILKGDIVADLILKDEQGKILKEVPLYSESKIAPYSFKKIGKNILKVLVAAGLIWAMISLLKRGMKFLKQRKPRLDV